MNSNFGWPLNSSQTKKTGSARNLWHHLNSRAWAFCLEAARGKGQAGLSSPVGFSGGKLARFHPGGSCKCSTLRPMSCLCFCRCKPTKQCIVLNSVIKGALMLVLSTCSTSEICFLVQLRGFPTCCVGKVLAVSGNWGILYHCYLIARLAGSTGEGEDNLRE